MKEGVEGRTLVRSRQAWSLSNGSGAGKPSVQVRPRLHVQSQSISLAYVHRRLRVPGRAIKHTGRQAACCPARWWHFRNEHLASHSCPLTQSARGNCLFLRQAVSCSAVQSWKAGPEGPQTLHFLTPLTHTMAGASLMSRKSSAFQVWLVGNAAGVQSLLNFMLWGPLEAEVSIPFPLSLHPLA